MSAETATAEAASTPDQPIISIKAVHKSFSDLEVLKGVSIDVMKGEVICIIGPSGSGKSTLIRCINALNDIQSGSIQVEGQERTEDALCERIGQLLETFAPLPCVELHLHLSKGGGGSNP